VLLLMGISLALSDRGVSRWWNTINLISRNLDHVCARLKKGLVRGGNGVMNFRDCIRMWDCWDLLRHWKRGSSSVEEAEGGACGLENWSYPWERVCVASV
jgi:hypothetical protein